MARLSNDIFISSFYLHNVLNPYKLKKLVALVSKIIRRWEPNTIIVRGVSGQSIGFPVSCKTEIPIGIVRKPNEQTHSSYKYEGPFEIGRYVVIDDFIETGKTLEEIKSAVNEFRTDGSGKCCGVILYRQSFEAARAKGFHDLIRDIFDTETKIETIDIEL